MTPFYKYTMLVAAVILAIAACRKDRQTRRQGEPSRLLMRTTEANKVNRYEYTPQGQVSKQVYFAGFTTADSLHMYFSYNNGLPEKMTAGGDETRYFYSDGHLVKMEVYSGGSMQYYWEYQYENGRPALETGFEKVNGGWKANARRVLAYDAKGNLARREYHTDEHHTGTFQKVQYVEFSGYLERPDPQAQMALQRQMPGTRNMPRLCTAERWFDGQGFEEWQTEYAYQFNPAGYPLEKSVVSRNPDGHVISKSTVTYAYNR